MLRVVPSYNELNKVETSKAFKGYTRSYSIEITEKRSISSIDK